MTRLKKLAELQDLGDLNMPSNVLNTIIQVKDASDTVNSVVYRRNMNHNTKFIVEIWELTGEKYAVFYGHFEGEWTQDNVQMSEIFDSLNEAQLYVQTELQGEAETQQLVVGYRRLNNFRKLFANGQEPNYSEIAKGFQKHVNIPDVEMKHKDHLNKYYDQFQDYMTKYYPDWAHYPAYIWRGWNYFTDSTAKEEPAEEPKDETPVETEVPVENTEVTTTEVPVDTVTDGDGDSQ